MANTRPAWATWQNPVLKTAIKNLQEPEVMAYSFDFCTCESEASLVYMVSSGPARGEIFILNRNKTIKRKEERKCCKTGEARGAKGAYCTSVHKLRGKWGLEHSVTDRQGHRTHR